MNMERLRRHQNHWENPEKTSREIPKDPKGISKDPRGKYLEGRARRQPAAPALLVDDDAATSSGIETASPGECEHNLVECSPNWVNIPIGASVNIILPGGPTVIPKKGCSVTLTSCDGSGKKLKLDAWRGLNDHVAKLQLPPKVWPVAETVDVTLYNRRQILGQGKLTFYQPPVLPTLVYLPATSNARGVFNYPAPYSPYGTPRQPESAYEEAEGRNSGEHHDRRIVFCRENDKQLIDEYARLAFQKFANRFSSSDVNIQELQRCLPEFVHVVEAGPEQAADNCVYDYATLPVRAAHVKKKSDQLVLPAELKMSTGTALKILWDFRKGTISLDRAVEEGRDYIIQNRRIEETLHREIQQKEKEIPKKKLNPLKSLESQQSRTPLESENSPSIHEKTSLYSSDSYGTTFNDDKTQASEQNKRNRGRSKKAGKEAFLNGTSEFDSDSSATHFTTTSHSETDSGYVNFQVLNAQRSAVKEEGHTKAGSEKDLKANPKLKSVSTAEFSVLPFPKTQPSMVSCSEKMGYCRRPIQGCKQPGNGLFSSSSLFTKIVHCRKIYKKLSNKEYWSEDDCPGFREISCAEDG
eukprot:m.196664 g.196664  ORF g.196664 m.196664 type:complete len:582 (+) comp39534_c0_seq17:751-2496(+)